MGWQDEYDDAIRNAERERCAKIAEEYPTQVLHVYARGPNDPPGNQMVIVTGQKLIAAAIRGDG